MTKQTIGIFPGSFKPFHAGHEAVVRHAESECDRVMVFGSNKTRDNITVEMVVEYAVYINQHINHGQLRTGLFLVEGSPIKYVYEYLDLYDKSVQDPLKHLDFIIYGDENDVASTFPQKNLDKYLPRLVREGRIKVVGLKRMDTVNVSGTQVRQHLANGDKNAFLSCLPEFARNDQVWSIFNGRP